MEKSKEKFSKYERARILGARALQISMDAPLILKIKKEELESVNFDPLRIAEKELDSGVLPISVNRPLPKKVEEKQVKIKVPTKEVPDEKILETESQEVREIKEEGEIMELITPEDEVEEEFESSGSEGGED